MIGAIFLGLGRALGETMAVTFVLGNAHDLSASLLMPSNSIAAAIANEFTEADTDLYRSSLIALGFLLFVVTFIVLDDRQAASPAINKQMGRTPLMAIPARRRVADVARLRLRDGRDRCSALSGCSGSCGRRCAKALPRLTPTLFTQMTPPPVSSGGLLNAFSAARS